jgi:hypothetical protein
MSGKIKYGYQKIRIEGAVGVIVNILEKIDPKLSKRDGIIQTISEQERDIPPEISQLSEIIDDIVTTIKNLQEKANKKLIELSGEKVDDLLS